MNRPLQTGGVLSQLFCPSAAWAQPNPCQVDSQSNDCIRFRCANRDAIDSFPRFVVYCRRLFEMPDPASYDRLASRDLSACPLLN